MSQTAITVDAERWKKMLNKIACLRQEIAKVIIGQEGIIELMLVALLCRGHCVIVGVPGLAKTLLVSTIGKALGLTFRRIQFTPDLMPMDITGGDILQETGDLHRREFEFVRGPIFANLILADEINRTPPKTQAALLEAMQEQQVTVGNKTMPLPQPFIVYATQNPIEHEGTYPLPEAQLDRFFFYLLIDYPGLEKERQIVLQTTGSHATEVSSILSPEEVREMQNLIREIPIPDHVLDKILHLTYATHPQNPDSSDYIKKYVEWGAGPRASQCLAMASKALAFLREMAIPSLEEVYEVARPVLRHRIIPNYNATGEGITVEDILTHLLKTGIK